MVQIGNDAYIAYAWGHRIKWGDCMVGKSSHCFWCLIGWAPLNGTTSNKVTRLIEMVKKYVSGISKLG